MGLFPNNTIHKRRGNGLYPGTPLDYDRACDLAEEVLEWHDRVAREAQGGGGYSQKPRDGEVAVVALGLMAVLASNDHIAMLRGLGQTVADRVVEDRERYDKWYKARPRRIVKPEKAPWFEGKVQALEECGLYTRPESGTDEE